MNDRCLEGFIAVAEQGSFNKAAQCCYLTPQTLMQQVNGLEAEVGVKLLERSSRGARLTAAGERFYEGARQIVALEKSIVESSRHAALFDSCEVVVGIQGLPMMTPAVSATFARDCPHIAQRFVNVAGADWLTALIDGSVDVVEHANSSELNDLGLGFVGLVREKRCCLVSRANQLAGLDLAGPQDLAGQTVYVHKLTGGLVKTARYLQERCALVKVVEKSFDPFGLIEVCLNGGVYLLPESHARSFDPLVPVALDVPYVEEFGLAFRKGCSEHTRMYIESARTAYGL